MLTKGIKAINDFFLGSESFGSYGWCKLMSSGACLLSPDGTLIGRIFAHVCPFGNATVVSTYVEGKTANITWISF